MPFNEEIHVVCDETQKPLKRMGRILRFQNHSEALKAAEKAGWFVTNLECLSPEGYEVRYLKLGGRR